MHPEIGQARADPGLGLGDLVGVMDGNMVLAPAVDVEIVAEIFLRHRRAFDMPPGKADTPWARPFHLALLAGRRKLPQREVGRALFFAELDPPARVEAGLVQPRQIAVIGLPGGIEIDAVRGPIRIAVLFEAGGALDLLADVGGSSAEPRRRLDVQTLHVVDERRRIELRDLPRAAAGAPRALFQLVFAGVRAGSTMS